MNTGIAKLISLVALGATILPALVYFSGLLGLSPVKWISLAATIIWFAATPLWMGKQSS